MASNSPPAKKAKSDLNDQDETRDHDSETQKALEEIDACQNQIDVLNERASEDILKVEQKYNKLRKPFFEKRNVIIKRIPNFWVLAIANHQVLGKILDEEEGDCLHYMYKLEVEEFEDIKFGYKIKFYFEANPYMENDVLIKEFHLGGPEPCSKSTTIKWREGKDIVKLLKERNRQKQGRKRSYENPTFFTWYMDNCDPSVDEIAEIIKDDLWPNPLQYFLAPPLDDDTNGMNDEDEDSEEDCDDTVVVVEEVEDEDNNDDDGDEEEEDDDEEEADVVIEEDDDDGNNEPTRNPQGEVEEGTMEPTMDPADDSTQ